MIGWASLIALAASPFTTAWKADLPDFVEESFYDSQRAYITGKGLTVINVQTGKVDLSISGDHNREYHLGHNQKFVYYVDPNPGAKNPVLLGKALIVCIDRKTLARTWTKFYPGRIEGVAADDAGLYLLANGNRYVKMSPSTGEEGWSKTYGDPDDDGYSGNLAIGDGVILGAPDFGRRYAVDTKTGKLLWKNASKLNWYPTIEEGVAILRSKTLIARNLRTGSLLWEQPFSDGANNLKFYNRRLFYRDYERIACLDLKNGKDIWSKNINQLKPSVEKDAFSPRTWHVSDPGDLNLDLNGDVIWRIDAEPFHQHEADNGSASFFRHGQVIFAVKKRDPGEKAADKHKRLAQCFDYLLRDDLSDLIAFERPKLATLVGKWANPKDKSPIDRPSREFFEALMTTLTVDDLPCIEAIGTNADRQTQIDKFRILLKHGKSAYAQKVFEKIGTTAKAEGVYPWMLAAQEDGLGASEDHFYNAIKRVNLPDIGAWGCLAESPNPAHKSEALEHLTPKLTLPRIPIDAKGGKQIGTYRDSRKVTWNLIEPSETINILWVVSSQGSYCVSKFRPGPGLQREESVTKRAEWDSYVATGWHAEVENLAELTKDSDGDGLTDNYERAFGLDPMSKDTDSDGTPDDKDLQPMGAKRTLTEEEQIIVAAVSAAQASQDYRGAVCLMSPDIPAFEFPNVDGGFYWSSESHPVVANLIGWKVSSHGYDPPKNASWAEKYIHYSPDKTKATLEISGGTVGRLFYGITVTVKKIDGRWIGISIRDSWIA